LVLSGRLLKIPRSRPSLGGLLQLQPLEGRDPVPEVVDLRLRPILEDLKAGQATGLRGGRVLQETCTSLLALTVLDTIPGGIPRKKTRKVSLVDLFIKF